MKVSALLVRFTKHAGTLSREDLDVYDSELTKDLIDLHDQIQNNPVRMYDYHSPYEVTRYFIFTQRALVERLLPAIERSLKSLKGHIRTQVEAELDEAEHNLEQADIAGKQQSSKAIALLETAFSNLHDAIEIIRAGTRKVPKVRSLTQRAK